MTNQEDYYKILGVDPVSTLEEISRAYRAKARDYHPDRLAGVSDAVRRLAEEKLKEINAAYEILGDPEKKRRYDAERFRRDSPPIPEVTPSSINFNDIEPGRIQTGSFVIRNSGGPYSRIGVSDPDSWLSVSGYKSLAQDDELPLQVDIEAQVHDWGRSYSENIVVSLDDVEATVRVGLTTKTAPRVQESPRRSTPPGVQSSAGVGGQQRASVRPSEVAAFAGKFGCLAIMIFVAATIVSAITGAITDSALIAGGVFVGWLVVGLVIAAWAAKDPWS